MLLKMPQGALNLLDEELSVSGVVQRPVAHDKPSDVSFYLSGVVAFAQQLVTQSPTRAPEGLEAGADLGKARKLRCDDPKLTFVGE